LIFSKVIVKNYEIPFHPFANSLLSIIEDSVPILKQGFEIMHTAIPDIGLEHGLKTHNLDLIEQSFKGILKQNLVIDWKIFESLEPDIKKVYFEKLLNVALQQEKNTIALKLLKEGYGALAQMALIPRLESNPISNQSEEESEDYMSDDGENTFLYIKR
jgi:hypothetical protein